MKLHELQCVEQGVVLLSRWTILSVDDHSVPTKVHLEYTRYVVLYLNYKYLSRTPHDPLTQSTAPLGVWVVGRPKYPTGEPFQTFVQSSWVPIHRPWYVTKNTRGKIRGMKIDRSLLRWDTGESQDLPHSVFTRRTVVGSSDPFRPRVTRRWKEVLSLIPDSRKEPTQLTYPPRPVTSISLWHEWENKVSPRPWSWSDLLRVF